MQELPMERQLSWRELAALERNKTMSAPVPNANYAPNGYERVSPGHYRRREVDPEEWAANEMIDRFKMFRDDYSKPESEVMPLERSLLPITNEIRPPSATEANRLDDIATLVRLLTYGEMMDLVAAVWKMRPEGREVTEQELPGMWHRWSAKCRTSM